MRIQTSTCPPPHPLTSTTIDVREYFHQGHQSQLFWRQAETDTDIPSKATINRPKLHCQNRKSNIPVKKSIIMANVVNMLSCLTDLFPTSFFFGQLTPLTPLPVHPCPQPYPQISTSSSTSTPPHNNNLTSSPFNIRFRTHSYPHILNP